MLQIASAACSEIMLTMYMYFSAPRYPVCLLVRLNNNLDIQSHIIAAHKTKGSIIWVCCSIQVLLQPGSIH